MLPSSFLVVVVVRKSVLREALVKSGRPFCCIEGADGGVGRTNAPVAKHGRSPRAWSMVLRLEYLEFGKVLRECT